MFSLLFGNDKVMQGVGYGGSAWHDLKTFRKGRKFATLQQTKRDQQLVAVLKSNASSLRRNTVQDSTDIVATLKDVFANTVPTEWTRRMKVLVLSLTCLGLLLKRNDAGIGQIHEPDSLACVYNEFCQSALFLSKHYKGKEECSRLVERILQLQKQMLASLSTLATPLERVARSTIKNMDDPSQIYRQLLTPLRFEMVESMENHAFASSKQSPNLNIRKIFQELSALRTSLPVEYGSSVFVRVMEERLDLLRVVVVGPEDTPYANGCFLFDVQLRDYPNQPPLLKFLTTGNGTVRFNPNLYADGKVCLSLLGTFPGPGWIPGESTLLQVLVSIQSLIFVANPYYNEPLFGLLQTMEFVQKQSQEHNANLRRHTLRHAILPFLHGSSEYPEFRNVMRQHYRVKTNAIQRQLQDWQQKEASLYTLTEHIARRLVRRSKWDKRSRKAVDDLHGPVPKRRKLST